nr:translation initiation factor 2 [uncultured Actinoplanes sp.]
MPETFFLSPPGDEDLVRGPDERILWSGHCAVAEYAFEEPASLPRWTLPEDTEVVITEERVVYRDPVTLDTGELRWPWPQHLRVQPGNRDTGRSGTVTQIQLVCAGPADTYPALVFAGGDLATVGDADRLANTLRQAIARFRVEHAGELGLTAPEGRMLSRLVIGPEFSNYQGGEGQTVSLLGSLPVETAPAPPGPRPLAAAGDDWDIAHATSETTQALTPRPAHRAAEPVGWHSEPALPAGWEPGQQTTDLRRAMTSRRHHPDPAELASRASDLAARVAMLVSETNELESRTADLSSSLGRQQSPGALPPHSGEVLSRAESVRRTAARLAGNAPRGRGTPPQRRPDDAHRRY